jgi:hypothetical protein
LNDVAPTIYNKVDLFVPKTLFQDELGKRGFNQF